MGVTDALYKVVFKRSTTYIPFIFLGAYFANEALDTAVNTMWETRNQGKLFKHLTLPASEE